MLRLGCLRASIICVGVNPSRLRKTDIRMGSTLSRYLPAGTQDYWYGDMLHSSAAEYTTEVSIAETMRRCKEYTPPAPTSAATKFASWAADHDTITVASFNLLAPCYKRLAGQRNSMGRTLRESHSPDAWQKRADDTLAFLKSHLLGTGAGAGAGAGAVVADAEAVPALGGHSIIALQEFWLEPAYRQQFQAAFVEAGYTVHTLRRGEKKRDSVGVLYVAPLSAPLPAPLSAPLLLRASPCTSSSPALTLTLTPSPRHHRRRYRTEEFDLCASREVHLVADDRVALLSHLHHKPSGRAVVVVSTHLTFPHSLFDRQLQMKQVRAALCVCMPLTLVSPCVSLSMCVPLTRANPPPPQFPSLQVSALAAALASFSEQRRLGDACLSIVAGDFNVEGRSPVCQFLRSQGYVAAFDVGGPVNNRYVYVSCVSVCCLSLSVCLSLSLSLSLTLSLSLSLCVCVRVCPPSRTNPPPPTHLHTYTRTARLL